MATLLAVLVLAACSSREPAADVPVPPDAAPAITDASVACDARLATWTFLIETDAWTGNGDLWLSTDGAYTENHALSSIAAAADGSSDQLRSTLSIVADWRDVVPSARTWFNCGTPELAGVLRVRARDGSRVTDCVAFGDAPERWSTWRASVACDDALDTGATAE